MMQRGKFNSLTMVNWNGFFARTFDLDTLVTTLSGGNGAGKSTTMAAFITALIPDQSLLHFRNTTEAGSSAASRDKGLHGKLKPGTCYALLDVTNSRQERLLCGVRLQQVAGRDKKVDIKPFIVSGLPTSVKPTDIVIEQVTLNQVRVRQIQEVKATATEFDGVQVKLFNSVTEYHSHMFDQGVLPKKLRHSSDRSKFYRLIEASLYGGISSAITKSLRDYLLPQNGGVKKAFQDMEVALRENRMTLEAIKLTQHDRDLFKHLITESTNYVASDYMRIANERRQKIEHLVKQRSELTYARRQASDFHQRHHHMTDELTELSCSQMQLEQDFQAASDHLQLVQAAVRQQEKVVRYQDELEELAYRLEEQMLVVEEASSYLLVAEEQTTLYENEVDSLKSQLADYQQALDVQQTRALQYQQALAAREKARDMTSMPTLDEHSAVDLLSNLKKKEEALTVELLELKHALDLSEAGTAQFEKGLALLARLAPDVSRESAGENVKQHLAKGRESRHLAHQRDQLISQYSELTRLANLQQQATQLHQDYLSHHQVAVDTFDTVEMEIERQETYLESIEAICSEQAEKNRDLVKENESLVKKIDSVASAAPAWISANEALHAISEQVDVPLNTQQDVLDVLQQSLLKERQAIDVRDKMALEKNAIDAEIERLSLPGGSGDARLHALADTLGGTLLSEIYDDITIEDAPYFSALYGPARHAIVVPDIRNIKEKLKGLEDCPDDLYIIEGDADSFDDSVFSADEMDKAVCVHINDRQIRYSRFPDVPLFGRAARELRLNTLRERRENLIETYAKASFDAQKLQRVNQSINYFVAHHLYLAFQSDPEERLKALRDQHNANQRELSQLREKGQHHLQQRQKAKDGLASLQKLQHLVSYLDDATLGSRLDMCKANLTVADEAVEHLHTHGKTLDELEAYVSILQNPPAEFDAVKQRYDEADQQLLNTKKTVFVLSDLVERRHHFAYQDAVTMLDKSSELSDQLKNKLVTAETQRTESRDESKRAREKMAEYNQVLISLRTSHQAKLDTLNEFKRELVELGVRADEESEARAREQKETINTFLIQSRQRITDLEKGLMAIELECKTLERSIKKLSKEYTELRKFVVIAKAGWVAVLKIARDSGVVKQLHRREMAYMSAEELRSLSDKSLGALRLAVTENELLRDALRASEDSGYPERKVLFYVAVYQHLRERIRQDIIQTDDPIEAIEGMEVELARLTDELTQRESRLAISSESVANIIQKTIQREQNRVRMLNQGLSNIGFGQVTGVRLNVSIRQTHLLLLNGLAEQAELHRDLFNNNRLSFSESMAKLYQRLNPHIDLGQRSPQIFGEELLDYRNYLELSIEVNRGADGWLKAESGALSTGEAIGTGQAILLMVVQSWEDESRRLRSKDILPCRLLFLDEAARLDAKSISTLFELCHRLDMQLLIAAPENISPEQGTTYKLVRKIFNDKEHVHVVGLRGFAQFEHEKEAKEETLATAS